VNAERLHAIVKVIQSELAQVRSVENLQQLVSSLENQVSQPQEPTHQQAVSKTLTTLLDALDKAPSNSFSPAWRRIAEEVGAAPLLGSALAEHIREIFKRNQITVTIALQELQELQQNAAGFKTAIDQAAAAIVRLKIGTEQLLPGTCELGVMIPRKAVDNRLGNFADELEELAEIFETIAEFATGRREKLTIRTISSSDFSIYVDLLPQAAALAAVAIERIVHLYKTLLEIRKLNADLAKHGVPEKDRGGVIEYANKLMKDGIEQLVIDATGEYCKVSDDGRRNELQNGIRIYFNKIANRIDGGYNLEVRAEPEAKSAAGGDDARAEAGRHIETVRQAAKAFEFMRLEGEPILSLPESDGARKDGGKKGASGKR